MTRLVEVADVFESTALGNLAQFEPAPDAVPLESATNTPLDGGEAQWIVWEAAGGGIRVGSNGADLARADALRPATASVCGHLPRRERPT
jgi:hypothetical protein